MSQLVSTEHAGEVERYAAGGEKNEILLDILFEKRKKKEGIRKNGSPTAEKIWARKEKKKRYL